MGKGDGTMTEALKRRRYLVKPWFQIRYMLLLVCGIIVGGIVYAGILQVILRHRMELMIASGGTVFSSQEMWFSLYPMVAISTLSLFLVGTLLLFFLLRVFVSRTSSASLLLEKYYRRLAKGDINTPLEGHGGVPEFQALAIRTADLVLGYQRKWSAIATKAEEVHSAAGTLAGESEPYRRLLALRECEHRAISLGESCTPRRWRRK
jgi:hypothetical protein